MVKAALPTSLIVNKIRTSKNNFNTSTGELIRFQQLRVAEIRKAMVEARPGYGLSGKFIYYDMEAFDLSEFSRVRANLVAYPN